MAGKEAASFMWSLMQKMQEGQNCGNVTKDSISHAVGTVLNEAANRVNQGGSWKKKRKKTESLNWIYGTITKKEENAFEYRNRARFGSGRSS